MLQLSAWLLRKFLGNGYSKMVEQWEYWVQLEDWGKKKWNFDYLVLNLSYHIVLVILLFGF